MYFFPVFILRLLVEDVIRSFLVVRGEEEGAIMDWDITLLAGAAVGVVGDGMAAIISPDMDWLMLGGRSPTPFMLELSPANSQTVN